MKLTAKLAYSQLINNKTTTLWTLFGVVLSISMLMAIGGVAYSIYRMVRRGFQRFMDEGFITGKIVDAQMIGMYVVIGIFTVIIVIIGGVVMSNAFSMSADKRINQFGILKSAGATKRQIISTVMYEAVWLSVIGIPVGLVLGVALQFGVTAIMNRALVSVNIANGYDQYVEYLISVPVAIASAVIGFLTVLMSAWLPASKAAQISAISAIRRNERTDKKKAKKPGTPLLLPRVFGAEGLLADKYMSLNKKRYAAVVRSLTLSTILLIIGGAFAENLHSAFVLAFPEIRYTSAVTVGVNLSRNAESVDAESSVIEEVSAALDSYKDPQAAAVMFNPNYTAELRADAFTADYRKYVSGENTVKANIISFDDGTYRKILDLAGAKYGEVVLFNRWNYKNGNKVTLFAPFVFTSGLLNLSLLNERDGTREHFEIGGELTEFPIELTTILNVNVPLNIIVPKGGNPTRAVWFYDTADAEGLSAFYSEELQGKGASYFFNLEADKNASESIQMVFNSVLFIFVGAVVFIGLSGIISTIATQTGIRRKEIAILKSVGETESGILKMFAAESLLYGVKSLVYGGAVGIPLAYFAISSNVGAIVIVRTERLMPMGSIAAAVGIIAAVVAFTTLYSVRLSRSVNLIDAIRSE
jgi:putative ABC transport system permease protein